MKTGCFKDFTTNVLRSDSSLDRRVKSFSQGWGDGSVVKSTTLLLQRTQPQIQHSPMLGSSHSPVTPAPGNSMTSSGLQRNLHLRAHTPKRNIIKIKIIF